MELNLNAVDLNALQKFLVALEVKHDEEYVTLHNDTGFSLFDHEYRVSYNEENGDYRVTNITYVGDDVV